MVALEPTRLRVVLALVVLLAVLVVLMPVVVAWTRLPPMVDGWPIGQRYTCTDADRDRPCSVLLPLAQKALDHRDPSHAAVVSAVLYEEVPVTRSSPFRVAVFHLADGSVRAIGIGYAGVGRSPTPMTLDYGP